jgi:hypothetical protein
MMSKACDKSMISGEKTEVFPKNIVIWAENIAHAKKIESILPYIAAKIKCGIEVVRWDTENMSFMHDEYKSLQECVNSMFTVERECFKVIILVGCGICGVNMNNLDAQVKFDGSVSASKNVQQYGRSSQPCKNLDGTYNRLSLVIDVLPNRRLEVIKQQEMFDNASGNPDEIRKTAEFESMFSISDTIFSLDGSIEHTSFSEYSFDNLYQNLRRSHAENGIASLMNNIQLVPDSEIEGYSGNKNYFKILKDVYLHSYEDEIFGISPVKKKKGRPSNKEKNIKNSYSVQVCANSNCYKLFEGLVCSMNNAKRAEFNKSENPVEFLLDYADNTMYNGVSYYECFND